MKLLDKKLKDLQLKLNGGDSLSIAIFGLGSVGNYLLTYLLSEYANIKVFIFGRSIDKMIQDVNIAKVAAGIRYNSYPSIEIIEVDFNNIDSIASKLFTIKPDIIVNSSRAYSHLKYGSISWNSIRAYGIWSPLSVKYIKTIMEAISQSNISPIVINTSYSDATNAWLKTGGFSYPDFGSGNLNHLIPRIKYAVAVECKIQDIQNIDVTMATSHFHDVVISKEGITEGIEPEIYIKYNGNKLDLDTSKIYKQCCIPMPSDEKRNMMNASSNFEIIFNITDAIKNHSKSKIHSPGFCGMIGGYPVEIDFSKNSDSHVSLFDKYFTDFKMYEANRKSIYLDGIQEIVEGKLIYTDELIDKTKRAFDYSLPKTVSITDSNLVANELILNIIEKNKK